MLLKLAQYFANNIRLLNLIILMILLLGTSALVSMPKAEDPQFDMPINVVEVMAPGMSPNSLESEVVGPIEQSLGLVEDIKTIETEIKQGAVTFTIKFLHGTGAPKSFDDVVNAVNRVRSGFPETVRNIIFVKASPITVNAVQLAVSSPTNDWQMLKRTSQNLQKRLQAIPIVRQAEVWGLPSLVVSVKANSAEMLEHNISIDDISRALAANSRADHAGYIDSDNMRFSINLSGEYTNFEELSGTIIKSDGSGHVVLSDIAELSLAPFKPDNLSYLNQQPVVFVTAQLKMGENIFNFGEAIRTEVSRFLEAYPEVEIQTTFDQESGVQNRVSGFMFDLFYGLLLILICLLFFMGLKQSFWVSLALPLTIFITIVIMKTFGFVLQQMTIAGLIVSLGLLVDNSLVVVEQFAKLKDQSLSRLDKIKQVLSEVGMPLVAGTLTTVFAFLPMLLLSSDTGDFMRALPVAVTIALVASLFVALIILPALISVFGVSQHSKLTLSYLLDKFAHGLYSKGLHGILKLPIVAILIFIAIAAGCISLFPQVGVSLFPKAEKNIIVVNVETPQFSSLNHTKSVALELSEKFEKYPSVTDVMLTVGSSNPRIYYNHIPRRGVVNFAQIMLLIDTYEREKVQAVISQIRTEYAEFAAAKVNVFEFQQGPVTDRPITIRFLGDDLEQLAERSRTVEAYLEKQKLVFDVRNISSNAGWAYDVRVDEYLATKSSIGAGDVEQQVRNHLDGTIVGNMTDRYGQGYPIVVKGNDIAPEVIDDLLVVNAEGMAVPLNAVARVELNKLQGPFYHYQRMRMNSVSADVLPGGNVAEITSDLLSYLKTLSWDDGLSYVVGGEEEARKENFGGLSEIMILVVLSIFVLLFVQFNSFAQPAVIISLLPIAFAGGVFGMFMTGISFSMMAFIGLISLIGIMVNDAIIVVDGFNRGVKNGLPKKVAMVQSASSRFTPVILTSLTTIVGLLPLTLYGGELWQPMGTVIITGLLFTTLASLVWVPALTVLISGRNANTHNEVSNNGVSG